MRGEVRSQNPLRDMHTRMYKNIVQGLCQAGPPMLGTITLLCSVTEAGHLKAPHSCASRNALFSSKTVWELYAVNTSYKHGQWEKSVETG